MNPYVDMKDEFCYRYDCMKKAIVKVVTIPNGIVIPVCDVHIVELANNFTKRDD